MGSDARCRAIVDGETVEVRAFLETDEIVLRSDRRIVIPFRDVTSLSATGEWLRIGTTAHQIELMLGRDAAKWEEKIRKPKSVIEKIGVKPGQRVSVIGKFDSGFVEKLAALGADVSRRLRKSSDVIFAAIDTRAGLHSLDRLRSSLAPTGAIWVVRPKGTAAIRDADVIAACKGAGLVDVKVVRFSDTHTAEKLVIPLARRG